MAKTHQCDERHIFLYCPVREFRLTDNSCMGGVASGNLQWRLRGLLAVDATAYAAENSWTEALSSREREVLQWVALGKTNWEIGRILHISPGTVRRHLENIYLKLGVHSRLAAVLTVLNQAVDMQ